MPQGAEPATGLHGGHHVPLAGWRARQYLLSGVYILDVDLPTGPSALDSTRIEGHEGNGLSVCNPT